MMDAWKDALRRQLVEHRGQLVQQLSQIDRDRSQPLERDLEDQASELASDEPLAMLEHSIGRELDQIDQAVSRIDDGDYGACDVCGGDIPAKRLTALPTTTLCVECARKAETAKLRSTGRGGPLRQPLTQAP